MTPDELKALLEQQQAVFLKALDDRDAAINVRLKAFEEAPALKSSGFVTMDGGAQDPEVKSFADFALAIQRNDRRRLSSVYKSGFVSLDGQEMKALGESTGPSGGFAVPVEYETQISKLVALASFIEALCFPVPMNAETKKIPMLKQTDNPTSSGEGASGYFGGMYFNLESEGAQIDEREPDFAMLELRARKGVGLTVSSNELRDDAPTIEAELMALFAEGVAAFKQYLFLLGNGAGKPLGMLSAANPARLLVPRKGSGNNIEIADVSKLISRMIPSLAGNAIFAAHPFAIEDLMQLSLVTNGEAAFVPASGQAEGSPLLGTLIGKPVYASEHMALPGTAGDLALIAPRAYAVGNRRGTVIAGSEHYKFGNDQYTWRVTTRFDGQPRIDGTVKLADGSNSEVSAFCVLS
jgi:HK97 family phage major capsid protein